MCIRDRTWSNNFDLNNFNYTCGEAGSITVTFIAEDECGNQVSTTANFVVQDLVAPTIATIPEDLVVECDGFGNTTLIQNWLTSGGNGVAHDQCSGTVSWTNDYSAANLSNACTQSGNTIVTFTASDECGNSIDATATLSIVDTTPPLIITDPQNFSVECDGSGNFTDITSYLNSQGGAQANDVCSGFGIVWSHNYSPLNFVFDCGDTASIDITFTATDQCGNSDSRTATFTIVDTTDPQFTVLPQDATAECDGNGNLADINAWLNSNGGAAVADNCTGFGFTWSHNFNAANFTDDCGGTGEVEVEFTVTDPCGNSASRIATFTIVDNTVPTIDTAAQNGFAECDGAGNAQDIQDWLDLNGNAVVVDNCSGSSLSWTNNYNPAFFSNLCGQTGSITVTFTATDDCGNSSWTAANFILVDTQGPTIDTPPNDLIIECLSLIHI